MLNVKKSQRILALVGLLSASFLASNANAAPCGTSGGLDTSNMIFRTNNSDGCGGVFSGNDSLAAVNLVANNLLFGGTNWTDSLKDDSPGSPGSGTATFSGIDWTLSANAGTSGSWSLSIADPAPASLPVTIDFLAVLKAGNFWSAYFFDNETFTTVGSNPGTFNIVFTNNGNQIPDLSHLTLYARAGTPPGPPDQIPEPSLLWLLGSGLIGLAGLSGKKKH